MENDTVLVRRAGRKKKLLILVLITLALAAAATIWLNAGMHKAMQALAISRVRSVAARAMNNAILECLGSGSEGENVINVRDTGERVYLLETDAYRMNALAAQCAEAAQNLIAAMGEQGISVPLGTITGIPVFTGKGPNIRVKFTPAGSVTSAFDTEFSSSGINQTLYRVKLRLSASVQIVMPGVYDTVSVTSEAAIAESVIVGEVPQVYTDVANNEDMLNLIPTDVP